MNVYLGPLNSEVSALFVVDLAEDGSVSFVTSRATAVCDLDGGGEDEASFDSAAF